MKNFAASILLLSVLSCNKSEDQACTTSTASLTGTYKLTGSTYKQTSSSDEEDLFVAMDACEKDDILMLKANDVYEAKDAGVACTPAGDETGTWSLSGSNIIIDGQSATIKSFNCSTLVLVTSNAFLPGDQITVTMQKQ